MVLKICQKSAEILDTSAVEIAVKEVRSIRLALLTTRRGCSIPQIVLNMVEHNMLCDIGDAANREIGGLRNISDNCCCLMENGDSYWAVLLLGRSGNVFIGT